jgi:hypothetical protein
MDGNRMLDGYLELCSLNALESLVLARMNQAANLRTEARQVLRQWAEAEVDAKIARWMLAKRRAQRIRSRLAPQTRSLQLCFENVECTFLIPTTARRSASTIQTSVVPLSPSCPLGPDFARRDATASVSNSKSSRASHLRRIALVIPIDRYSALELNPSGAPAEAVREIATLATPLNESKLPQAPCGEQLRLSLLCNEEDGSIHYLCHAPLVRALHNHPSVMCTPNSTEWKSRSC